VASVHPCVLPERYHAERDVRRLYDGLRNAISHEYGTREVLLTHANPSLHWTVVADDIRFLDLHTLLDDFEAAFENFYADLETQPDLRARVLPHAQGLLAPVAVEVPVPSTLTLHSAAIAASASATAPDVRHVKWDS
jgi:hypothetical protein